MNLARLDRPREATFDLTPMIDVVLLLIIFFMLSSQFAATILKPMPLPKEDGHGAPKPTSAVLVIDVDRDGAFTALGRALDHDELRSMIAGDRSASAEHSATTVLVRADRHCPAVHLKSLADMLASLGVLEWRLATVPTGQRPAAAGGAP